MIVADCGGGGGGGGGGSGGGGRGGDEAIKPSLLQEHNQ